MPTAKADLLLKADLKSDSDDGKAQSELVEALVPLNGQKTLLGRMAFLQGMKTSKTPAVADVADRTLKTLAPAPGKK